MRAACRARRSLQQLRAGGSWASQETPNPNVWKFEGGLVPHEAPEQIRALPHVRDVLVHEGGAWLAVTRQPGASWQALAPQVQQLLQELPEPSAVQEPLEKGEVGGLEEAEEILEVLEHRIRPSVQADGGDVQLQAWHKDSGEVVLRLQGACRGCPQSAVTLQESILKTLRHFVPAVRSVRAEEEVDDASNPSADIPWSHSGEAAGDTIREMVAGGMPIFSTFAGMKVDGPKLRRIRFKSEVQLGGRTPEHIFVTCVECHAKRTIEDPLDLLRPDKGNATGRAAVAICPTCCVVIST
ncbi:unnamed protein product [Effrenium voratum]|nr:unnamed protein product [Effrenium voratum]